jgi:ubiquinone/menaquinone biosynthesis C-methylase UbiE
MTDRSCPAWALDNPVRRLLSPPRRTVGRLDPRRGDRIVDLGAGVGYYADEVLSRIGPEGHLTLVDINGAALARFAERHGPDRRLEIVRSTAASVPQIPTSSRDRILLADMLCDVDDKAGILGEAYRMLRPGGVAYVSFHMEPRRNPRIPLRPTPREWEEARRGRPWEERRSGGTTTHPWYLLGKPSTDPSSAGL